MPRNETIPRQAGKRPIKPLSAQEKVNAIKRVHEGESKASVARDIGVPESTLRGWCKAQHKLFSQAKNQSSSFEGSIQPIDSGSDDDRSSPRSGSSRSPPRNGNVITGVSNLAMREASSDDAEVIPPAKRAKLADNCTPPVVTNSMSNLMVNTSSQAHGLHYNGDLNTFHYQRLMSIINSNPETARLFQQNSIYNALSVNLLNAQNGIQYSRNNGAVSNVGIVNNPLVAANAIVANNVVLNGANDKRKHSTARQVLNSNRRHANLPIDGISGTERSATPMVSGISNGGTIESSSSRSRQENRSFEEILHQLQAQQHLQQQHNAFSEALAQAYQRMCTTILLKNTEENTVLERKKRLEEALQQNKNTYDENESRNRPNGIPIGIDTALNQAQSLEKWLKEYGSPYFTFQNVKMIQRIINKLEGWMEASSKSEEQSKNNNNTAS